MLIIAQSPCPTSKKCASKTPLWAKTTFWSKLVKTQVKDTIKAIKILKIFFVFLIMRALFYIILT